MLLDRILPTLETTTQKGQSLPPFAKSCSKALCFVVNSAAAVATNPSIASLPLTISGADPLHRTCSFNITNVFGQPEECSSTRANGRATERRHTYGQPKELQYAK